MYCNNCGHQVAEGSKFCDNCGSGIAPVNTYNASSSASVEMPNMVHGKGVSYWSKGKVYGLVLLICSLCIFAAGALPWFASWRGGITLYKIITLSRADKTFPLLYLIPASILFILAVIAFITVRFEVFIPCIIFSTGCLVTPIYILIRSAGIRGGGSTSVGLIIALLMGIAAIVFSILGVIEARKPEYTGAA